MPKKPHFSTSQKAEIVLEILREDKSIAQIASGSNADTKVEHVQAWLDALRRFRADQNI